MLRARGRNRLFRLHLPSGRHLAAIFAVGTSIVDSSFTLLTTHGLPLDEDLVAFALCESWEWHTAVSTADLPTGNSRASNPTRARFTAEPPSRRQDGLRCRQAQGSSGPHSGSMG